MMYWRIASGVACGNRGGNIGVATNRPSTKLVWARRDFRTSARGMSGTSPASFAERSSQR